MLLFIKFAIRAVLLIAILLPNISLAKGWQKITSDVGRFEVMMPGKPSTYHKSKHTAVGKIGEQFYTYKDNKLTLTLEYSDLPAIATIFGGHHEIYKKSKQGFLKSTSGQEISFINISINGLRGKELTYKTPTRAGKVVFLLVNRRLYVVQASMLKSIKDQSNINRYIHSFEPIYKKHKFPSKRQ